MAQAMIVRRGAFVRRSAIGATVTPIDDWEIWVGCTNCGQDGTPCQGLNPGDYATIAELLEDMDAMEELMNSANAVDYMIRSKAVIMPAVVASASAMAALDASSYALSAAFNSDKWYAAMMASATAMAALDATAINHPAMTSNTAPSGVASASAVYSSNPAYRAFDHVTGSSAPLGWAASANPLPWVQYQFANNSHYVPYKITLFQRAGNPDVNLRGWKLRGSNDGTTFTDIVSGTCADDNSGAVPQSFIVPQKVPAYNRFRLVCTSAPVQYIGVGELKLYCKEVTA